MTDVQTLGSLCYRDIRIKPGPVSGCATRMQTIVLFGVDNHPRLGSACLNLLSPPPDLHQNEDAKDFSLHDWVYDAAEAKRKLMHPTPPSWSLGGSG